jgi:hypothetical protein
MFSSFPIVGARPVKLHKAGNNFATIFDDGYYPRAACEVRPRVRTHKFAIEIGGTSHTGLRKMDRSQAVRGLPAPRR